jgi:hypothetical protein
LSRFDQERYESYTAPRRDEFGAIIDEPKFKKPVSPDDKTDSIDDADRCEYGFYPHCEYIPGQDRETKSERGAFERYAREFRQREQESEGAGFNNRKVGAGGYTTPDSPPNVESTGSQEAAEALRKKINR